MIKYGGTSLFSSLISWNWSAERVTWSWSQMALDMQKNSARSLVLTMVTGLSVGIVIACMSSFFFDIAYGLHDGAVFGTICGLIVGIAGLLTGMITSGWSSGMVPEDQHVRPNEGIIHSGRNALLGALQQCHKDRARWQRNLSHFSKDDAKGTVNQNVVPWPGALCTPTLPCCRSTNTRHK